MDQREASELIHVHSWLAWLQLLHEGNELHRPLHKHIGTVPVVGLEISSLLHQRIRLVEIRHRLVRGKRLGVRFAADPVELAHFDGLLARHPLCRRVLVEEGGDLDLLVILLRAVGCRLGHC